MSGYSLDEVAKVLKPIEGLTIIGTLPETLQEEYVELVNAETITDDLYIMYQKRFFEKTVDSAREAIDKMDTSQMQQLMIDNKLFDTTQEAVDFWKHVALFEFLRSQFWYNVRAYFQNQQPDIWNHWCEIRSEFRVVSTGKKFQK